MELEPTELSEAIRAVRSGLAAAQQEGDGLPIRFTVKEVVLDLGIEIRRTDSVGGGVKALVVSADSRGEKARVATHRMTLTLEVAPNGGGGDLLVGDAGAGRGAWGDGQEPADR
jgi:hypothetical protein